MGNGSIAAASLGLKMELELNADARFCRDLHETWQNPGSVPERELLYRDG